MVKITQTPSIRKSSRPRKEKVTFDNSAQLPTPGKTRGKKRGKTRGKTPGKHEQEYQKVVENQPHVQEQ